MQPNVKKTFYIELKLEQKHIKFVHNFLGGIWEILNEIVKIHSWTAQFLDFMKKLAVLAVRGSFQKCSPLQIHH